eukprot:TRINITY_DN318_c0_g1_i1.p1 TRINITY_DN318_c0_g1~~TRINITY_DN318_c0_g1_i1.p1  ORF type:complete len:1243 (-),score=407.47 TRINITY_DN318_c0_g1_i1:62-3790(-)
MMKSKRKSAKLSTSLSPREIQLEETTHSTTTEKEEKKSRQRSKSQKESKRVETKTSDNSTTSQTSSKSNLKSTNKQNLKRKPSKPSVDNATNDSLFEIEDVDDIHSGNDHPHRHALSGLFTSPGSKKKFPKSNNDKQLSDNTDKHGHLFHPTSSMPSISSSPEILTTVASSPIGVANRKVTTLKSSGKEFNRNIQKKNNSNHSSNNVSFEWGSQGHSGDEHSSNNLKSGGSSSDILSTSPSEVSSNGSSKKKKGFSKNSYYQMWRHSLNFSPSSSTSGVNTPKRHGLPTQSSANQIPSTNSTSPSPSSLTIPSLSSSPTSPMIKGLTEQKNQTTPNQRPHSVAFRMDELFNLEVPRAHSNMDSITSKKEKRKSMGDSPTFYSGKSMSASSHPSIAFSADTNFNSSNLNNPTTTTNNNNANSTLATSGGYFFGKKSKKGSFTEHKTLSYSHNNSSSDDIVVSSSSDNNMLNCTSTGLSQSSSSQLSQRVKRSSNPNYNNSKSKSEPEVKFALLAEQFQNDRKLQKKDSAKEAQEDINQNNNNNHHNNTNNSNNTNNNSNDSHKSGILFKSFQRLSNKISSEELNQLHNSSMHTATTTTTTTSNSTATSSTTNNTTTGSATSVSKTNDNITNASQSSSSSGSISTKETLQLDGNINSLPSPKTRMKRSASGEVAYPRVARMSADAEIALLKASHARRASAGRTHTFRNGVVPVSNINQHNSENMGSSPSSSISSTSLYNPPPFIHNPFEVYPEPPNSFSCLSYDGYKNNSESDIESNKHRSFHHQRRLANDYKDILSANGITSLVSSRRQQNTTKKTPHVDPVLYEKHIKSPSTRFRVACASSQGRRDYMEDCMIVIGQLSKPNRQTNKEEKIESVNAILVSSLSSSSSSSSSSLPTLSQSIKVSEPEESSSQSSSPLLLDILPPLPLSTPPSPSTSSSSIPIPQSKKTTKKTHNITEQPSILKINNNNHNNSGNNNKKKEPDHNQSSSSSSLTSLSSSSTSSSSSTMDIFGVFDGHNGRDAVEYVSSNIGSTFLETVESCDSPEEALKKAFLETNKRLKESGKIGGSTALLVLATTDHIYFANAGDCRAIVCKSKGKAERITNDHRPTQLSELKRIQEQGGTVTTKIGRDGKTIARVNGVLGVSRSFGDFNLGQVISPEPDIYKLPIPSSPNEVFVIATDGLFDVLADEDIGSIVQYYMNSNINNLETACVRLRDAAYHRDSKDNISVMLIQHYPDSLSKTTL